MLSREYEVMGRLLQIHLGDITEVAVDAIVSSENSDLIMDQVDGPSVSAAIRRVEGEAMAHDLARLGPLEPGRAVVLPARRLPCRWVIHAASVIRTEGGHRSSPEIIREAVRSALQLAAGLGLRSVAFPAFGVRAAELARSLASEAMVAEMVAALRQRTSIQRIVVALLDPESFLAFFEEAMRSATGANEPARVRVARAGGQLDWSFVDGGPLERLASAALPEPAEAELAAQVGRLRSAAERRLRDARAELEALGARLHALVPPQVRERLAHEAGRPLVLLLDEDLAHLPLELAWDGERFLVERTAVARMMRTALRAGQALGRPPQADAPRPAPPRERLEVLLVRGARGSLPGSAREAERVADLLWRRAGDRARATLLGGPRATRGALLDALCRVDVVHWCGHSEPEGAWTLAGGDALRPADVAGLPARARLVVANSCGSAASTEFARAFLIAGARNYVGTWWDVDDELARAFALALYEELVLGRTLGEALAAARTALREEDPLHWAAYLHYGDPRERLFQPVGL